MSIRIVLLTALIAVVGPWSSGPARADFMLVPPGLGPGDQFRIVFASSATRDALSSDIADYDRFITDLAVTAGLDTYFGTPVTWQVLGSTRSVSAISRLPLTSPGLYLLTGSKVADSGADLWDGTIDAAVVVTERLNRVPQDLVYTGTLRDGRAAPDPLGGSVLQTVEVGIANEVFTTEAWVSAGPPSGVPRRPFYGVSSVLTVPAAVVVPEPTSLTLVLAGLAALAGGRVIRRWPWSGAQAPVPPGG